MDKYLPIGSVVILFGGEKRLMIYGRVQKQLGTDVLWDYIACPFPEGNLDESRTFLFNHDQVERVYFLGLQDEEEMAFTQYLLVNAPNLRSGVDTPG